MRTTILLLGAITYIMVALTIISGMLKWKNKKHKAFAILSIIFASLHALFIILQ